MKKIEKKEYLAKIGVATQTIGHKTADLNTTFYEIAA